MDTIIAYRINGGKVQFVVDSQGEVAIFPDMDNAIDYASNNRLFQSGQADFQIISLDEL